MTITDYNHQADKWHRAEPSHLSDFVGRPEVLAIFREIGRDKVVMDMGCGEGYFARMMAPIAKKVIGVDFTEGMIRLAIEQEKKEQRGIEYHLGDVRDMPFIPDSSIDVCVGNYVVQYSKPEELLQFYGEMARVLVDNGKFVLLFPHPALHLVKKYSVMDYHHQLEDYDYIGSRGEYFSADLKTVQGEVFEGGMYHSTLEDHFNGISAAGLAVTSILEPVFTPEMTERYPLFKELELEPVTMIMVGTKLTSSPQLPSST